MRKKRNLLCLAALLLTMLTACGAPPQKSGEALDVLVSFDAMYEFASAVGGEKAQVSAIVPGGMEAHDFEPKAKDIAALSTADVLVLNGLDMEPWAASAVKSANNESLIVVESAAGIDPISLAGGHGYDPHVWLSLKGAEAQVNAIKDAFVRADPENAAYYEKNAADYAALLDALYLDYAPKFAALSERDFVTGHAAFSYLCRDFELVQRSVVDVFAEGEPSARQLSELVEYCRANGITTIFSEALASPEVSKTLADEVGAQVKPIYAMESAEDGLSYLERMEKNLSEIYESLKP